MSEPNERDRAIVHERLGRPTSGPFIVAVRDDDGLPAVIRNLPLLNDGTPMPTLYWLIDPELRSRIGTIESHGGVRRSEAAVDEAELRRAHDAYASERDRLLPDDHDGPRPTGGVGGTRRGVKCLHAHFAWYLAGGDDPIGRWVDAELRAMDELARAEAEL